VRGRKTIEFGLRIGRVRSPRETSSFVVGVHASESPSNVEGSMKDPSRALLSLLKLRVQLLVLPMTLAASGAIVALPSPFIARAGAVVQSSSAPAASLFAARRTAAEIGLDAAALAAVGLDADACAAMVQRLSGAQAAIDGFVEAKTSLAHASEALEAAREAAQDGSVEAAATIPARESAVQTATAAVAGVRAGLRAVALEGSSTTVIATLDAIDANRRRRVPTEFMVLSRTDAEWELLERAIRQEGRSLRTGEPMDVQYAAILAATRAEPAVAASAASIAAFLPSVEAALVAD